MTDQEWRERFANKLSYMIQKRGCTQSEFAEEVGMSEVTLSRYVQGHRIPKANILADLARALDCDPSDLIYF